MQVIFEAGAYGVQLFFVVSAISLTLSAYERREANWDCFAVRRFFRLAPMFYFGIALYLILFGDGPRLFAPGGLRPFDIAVTVAFVHVWWPNSINSVVPGDWSIGNEAMFYCALPILLAATRVVRPVILAGYALIGALLYLSVTSNVFGFPAQLPVFMFGIVAASLIRRPPAFLHGDHLVGSRAARWIGVVAFGIIVIVLPQIKYFNYLVFGECVAVLCIVLHFAPSSILVNRVMSRIGVVSYSIYVLHFAFLAPTFAVARWLAPPGGRDLVLLAIYFPLLMGASFLAATLTWKLIEQPGIALGRQLIGRMNAARAAPLEP